MTGLIRCGKSQHYSYNRYMNMNEPRHHHYIPQFILRNFCQENSRSLFYYDVAEKTTAKKDVKDIFAHRDLYRDEINNPEDRMKIERDFGIFEGEIAKIIKDRFLSQPEIVINRDEDEKIRLFFALMGFRSYNVKKAFSENASLSNKKLYSNYQKNMDLPDFWKRNLGQLVNCRSLGEIMENTVIDDPIKKFMCRDISGYFGRYISIVESPDSCEFVISDTYPLEIRGCLSDGVQLEMYSVYPLSARRALISVCEGAASTPEGIRKLRECIILSPIRMENQSQKIRVKKLYEEEVGYLNQEIITNAKIGVAFKNLIPRNLLAPDN